MPTQEEFDQLKGRIVELENQLKSRRTAREEISPEEMAAYTRVRDLLAADWGDFCGINDCFRCIVSRCVSVCVTRCFTPCIYECTCGPCNVGGFAGGAGHFGGLGG